ncbi:hypothetical protein [Sporomusa acidovorans]|uniref:Uncharacterized protein n=1 Tax=Sporomusa acidovorans (strain ATCC 49682 / DSM 3132 / Mol) TaxID=1123286 RepID=A0ABZ3IVS1_SPOA4|nr:hypothetical protein [Sporomusa acidovorans]OZC24029.1 hypothetical protein SPACI_02910 [Sporomusa acidovorans DSM 3132]SDF58700.1 hypothetical protein SAMN04488499_106022 [Sporomusa acidovorans]
MNDVLSQIDGGMQTRTQRDFLKQWQLEDKRAIAFLHTGNSNKLGAL